MPIAKANILRLVRQAAKQLVYLCFLGISVLLLLELSYRWYVVDFYGNNLSSLNEKTELTSHKDATILVVGDSFSADRQSYVKSLRHQWPDYRVVNSSIPGTCLRQHELFLPKRLQQFQPDLLLYQLYLGNDFLEFRPPVKSPNISLARRLYWLVSDYFLVIRFLNAKLPQIRQATYHDLPTSADPKMADHFVPQQYSARSQMQFRAEPHLVHHSAQMMGQRGDDGREITQRLKRLLQEVPSNCQVVLLVIPHCLQVHQRYGERLAQIGAAQAPLHSITESNYPFVEYLRTELADQRIHIANPLGHFQEAERQKQIYYAQDPHLNPGGQKILGDFLVDFLQKGGILGQAN
ncbi:MAG: hypothetical protein AAFV95_18480 [Bacteroidota bacterium]